MRLPHLSAGVMRTVFSGASVASGLGRGVEPSRNCGMDCTKNSQCTQPPCQNLCLMNPEGFKTCGGR